MIKENREQEYREQEEQQNTDDKKQEEPNWRMEAVALVCVYMCERACVYVDWSRVRIYRALNWMLTRLAVRTCRCVRR